MVIIKIFAIFHCFIFILHIYFWWSFVCAHSAFHVLFAHILPFMFCLRIFYISCFVCTYFTFHVLFAHIPHFMFCLHIFCLSCFVCAHSAFHVLFAHILHFMFYLHIFYMCKQHVQTKHEMWKVLPHFMFCLHIFCLSCFVCTYFTFHVLFAHILDFMLCLPKFCFSCFVCTHSTLQRRKENLYIALLQIYTTISHFEFGCYYSHYSFGRSTFRSSCPVGWGCRIHRLLPCRGVRPPNECPAYENKQSDGEVRVILELWEMRSTPSLPSLPGSLWPRVVAHDKGPIYGLNRTKPWFLKFTGFCI